MTPDAQQLAERIAAELESPDADGLKAGVADARAADIAEVLDLLDDQQRSRVLYSLSPRMMAEVVVELDEAVRGEVVEDLSDEKLTEIVEQLPPDDAADVVGELSLEQFDEVLEHIPRAQSDEIAKLLSYGEESAGGLMNPRLLSLPASATVAEAVEEVRAFAADEDLHYVYIVDGKERLVGVVPLRRLVVNARDTRLEEICERDPITVSVHQDQEEVLLIIQKYDLAAVPVINDTGTLMGRITYDDVMDVAAQEADEDIYRMAGTDAAELETRSAVRAARVRMTWLIPCIIGTLAAAGVIAFFGQTSLTSAHLAALLLFVPMIAATSGNAGIQTSTIVLRGFATGELAASRLQLVFAREVRIAVLVGLACSLVTGLLSGVMLLGLRRMGYELATPADVKPMLMGTAVSLGMLCAIVESVGLGITLPFFFRRVGVDPAIASGPLITSFNDLLSIAVYLSIALLILT
ncbi:MAG: magnesium transporter [Phycisphaerae bacterium]